MRVDCSEDTMRIVPETQADVDYIEQTLGLTANGMRISIERCDWWVSGGIGSLEVIGDSLNTECAVPIGSTTGEPRIGYPPSAERAHSTKPERDASDAAPV